MATEVIEELQPAKVPILPKGIVNSKKAHAMRKEQKRKLEKQRSFGSTIDYPPLPLDKHEPEFVSIVCTGGDLRCEDGLQLERIFRGFRRATGQKCSI